MNNLMSRDFTLTERILIVVLVIILLGLAYYYFVDIPVREAITNDEAECAMLERQLDTMERRLMALRSTQAALDELESKGRLKWMASYNNSKAEVTFLNDILADTLKYDIAFASVTRSGDQIRRSFTLQYTTPDFDTALDIMSRLLNGENRCLVGDVRCTIFNDGTVSMSEAATFYETLVGGAPDAALPADGAAVNY